jgi:SAM-dependent methyltransferase
MSYLGSPDSPLLEVTDHDTLAAYGTIAEEYDQPWHRTTRELERLSAIALREAPLDGVFVEPKPLVVELGCGTGAFSIGLSARMGMGQLLLSDPVAAMVSRAQSRLAAAGSAVSTVAFRATAAEILARLESPPALIAAGLADPYLSPSLLRLAMRVADRTTHMLVTVPTRGWAAVERGERLRIPIDRTRFNTIAGGAVHSRSLTLDADDLAELFAANGFAVTAHGTVATDSEGWVAAPEISWALARPVVAAVSRRD